MACHETIREKTVPGYHYPCFSKVSASWVGFPSTGHHADELMFDSTSAGSDGIFFIIFLLKNKKGYLNSMKT